MSSLVLVIILAMFVISVSLHPIERLASIKIDERAGTEIDDVIKCADFDDYRSFRCDYRFLFATRIRSRVNCFCDAAPSSDNETIDDLLNHVKLHTKVKQY